MSFPYFPKGRWTFATVDTMIRVLKRLNHPALWRSSIGGTGILLGVWILLRLRQGTIAELKASLEQASTRLLQTESTLKEYLRCVSALENVLAGRPEKGKGNSARISVLISTVEELQAEARTARANTDEIIHLKKHLQEHETFEARLNDQVLALSRQVDGLEADKNQWISEEISGLRDQLQLSEIRLEEKDDEIAILRRKVKNQFNNEVEMARKDAHILSLASALEQIERRREGEKEEISCLMAKVQALEVEVMEKDVRYARYPRCTSSVESSYDDEIGLSPELDTKKSAKAEQQGQATVFVESLGLLYESVETQQRGILQEAEVVAKLRAEAGHSWRVKDGQMCSLSDCSRLVELEGRVEALTLQNVQLENTRAQERDQYNLDIRLLQDSLTETNSIIAKGEDKIKELKADADAKEKEFRSLAQTKHMGTGDKQTSILASATKFKLTKSDPAIKLTKYLKLQKQSPPKESMPDAQTRAQYEQKIAELTDKLAECLALLKTSGISPASATSSLWPPPYEAPESSTQSPGQHSITTCRADEFSAANSRPLWQRVRASALPEISQ